MDTSEIALRQQIPVAVIARALKLEPGDELLVAPSTPFLTGAAISQALPADLSGQIAMRQLSFGSQLNSHQTYPSDFFDGAPIEEAPKLYRELSAKTHGSAMPVLVDALEYAPISATYRSGRKVPDLPKIADRLSSFVNDIEPGYLNLGDWGPYFWCLFALVMACGSKAAVLFPAGTLEANESARIQLVRAGFIEQVIYLPIMGNKHHYAAALLVLSSGNTNVCFTDCSSMLKFGKKMFEEPLGNRLDITIANVEKNIANYEVRDILKNHAALSLGAVRSAAISRGYTKTLAALFKRVPPFMPREGLCSQDVCAIPIRRISSSDFKDGRLLPGTTTRYLEPSEDPTIIKLDPATFVRYGLRAGDIVMPRLLGRAERINTLVVQPKDAKQNLVASHNATVIRPAYDKFTDEERVAYSEMVATYLTEGHGAKMLDALSAGIGSGMRSVRPSQLRQIEIPPALDPGTPEYSEHANAYVQCVAAKHQAEDALTQAQADLEAAKDAIAQELETICS